MVDRFEQLEGALRKTCPDLPDEAWQTVQQVIAGARNEWIRSTEKLVAQTLDDMLAEADGEEDESDQAYLAVSVNFNGRPPRVVMITSRGRTDLDEESVDVLDWVDIKSVDMIVRPYEWSVNGKSGVKAYLKSMFVTVDEDELELKYSEVPEAQESQED